MKITIRTRPSPGEKAAQLRQLAAAGIYQSLGRAAGPVREVMLFALRNEAPVKTGALRSGIDARQSTSYGGGVRLEFTSLAPYTNFVIAGTRPHDIYPVNAKALAFYSQSGELVFAKHVHHPGTQPNPFHERAWDRASDGVLALLMQTAREIAEVIVS